MFSLVIEGWRAYPQSHSIINQFHSLELLKRADVRLLHVEAPQPPPGFLRAGAWRATQGLLPAEDEAALAAIPAPQPGEKIDATLRLAFPVDFSSATQGRTFAFAVAEGARLNNYMVAGNRPLSEALGEEVAIITPSEFSRRSLIATGAEPSRVFVVPHGADTGVYRPLPEDERARQRRNKNFSEEDFVFLNVGALYSYKGIPILLRAFAVVGNRYPNAKLVLKGMDSIYASRTSVSAILKDLTAGERATVVAKTFYRGGTFSYATMAGVYGCADALVSAYQLEGFNMPVLEAIACGLPVICTAGGPTDEFTQDEFAWRINSSMAPLPDGSTRLTPDLDHLIHLMERAIEDRDFRHRAAATGPAFVEKSYSWARTTDRLLDVLKKNS